MSRTRSAWLLTVLALALPVSCGPRLPGSAPTPADAAPPKADVLRAADPAPAAAARKDRHALLVGVTVYPNLDKAKHLVGPGNDVHLLRKLLVEKFQFSPDHVMTLSEEEGKKRGDDFYPTKANIHREFIRLAKVAQAGDYVVISMSGHGSQQPEDPKSPDPEPDGLDEIFLPRDVGPWDGAAATVKNAIIDDELGAWLQAIQDKKAFVWVTLDSCHSGTMIRAVDERTRDLDPEKDLAIPRPAIDKAVKEAAEREAKKPERSRGVEPPAPLKLGTKGGVVAIYAAQPTEVTIEREMPPMTSGGTVHGLLTYTICQVLTQATEKSSRPLTYRELAQRIQSQYTQWGRTFPTPMIEGELQDAEVLGDKEWPGRSSIVLSGDRDGMKVNAGALRGLTRGSVLAVAPPPGQGDKLLGHVRVTDVRMVDSDVQACEFDKVPAAKDLPEGAVCRVVLIDTGDQQLRVAVDPLYDPPDGKEPQKLPEAERRRLAEVLNKLGGAELLLKPVEQAAQADWLVRWRPKPSAVVLVPGAGWSAGRDPAGAAKFGPAAVDDNLGDWLKDTLNSIAKVENLKRLAAGSETARGDLGIRIKVEPRLRESATDNEGKIALPWPSPNLTLYNKDRMAFRISNPGRVAADVTLLYIDSGYGISPLFPTVKKENNRLAPGEAITVKTSVTADLAGPEHLLVIAVKGTGTPVDFTPLTQPTRRGAQDVMKALGDEGKAVESPLGKLLMRGAYGEGTRRGMTVDEVEDYSLMLMSWHIKTDKRPPSK